MRETGQTEAACAVYAEIRRQNETVRDAYEQCNRKVTGILTVFARQGMFDFFVLSLKTRMQVLETARCG